MSKEDKMRSDIENAVTMKQGKNHVNFHVQAQDDKDAAYTTSPDNTGREEETDSNGLARDIVISVPKKLALNIQFKRTGENSKRSSHKDKLSNTIKDAQSIQ